MFLSLTLALTTGIVTVVLGFPADLAPSSTWYQIGESDLGPIYSTQPGKRDNVAWHQIGENELGLIYSSVDTSVLPRESTDQYSAAVKEYE